ncbi:hypothetical protein GQ44DRAFT_725787 [Phaeosphaeriaceae sp. PMI808]|nr:hypothetical protein GQ44DRAFT_725787 [Phaeosphaeriaceae sp. PMI808]
MKSKSLLRFIFRHGPHHAKSSIHAPESQITATNQSLPHDNFAAPINAPESPLAYKTDLTSHNSSILDQSANRSSSNIDNDSIAEALATLDLDVSTFTTHDLVIAAIDEARNSLNEHIDTVDTTLALLDALKGFSATIATLKEEMIEKRMLCEGRLVVLEDVERGVSHMQFGEGHVG